MLATRFGLALLVGGSLVSARGQDNGPRSGAADKDAAIPTRVTPPKAEKAAETKSPALKPSRPTAATVQRVEVRNVHDTPRNIMLRSDLRTFYLPHATYPTIDPGSAAWALEGAYLARNARDRAKLLDLYRFREANERQARLDHQHSKAIGSGVQRLRAGEYAAAVAALSLSAQVDRSDPVCRIHLAQARLALGQYEDAAAALRRAIELQPMLMYMDLRLSTYYPGEGELSAHVAKLAEWLRTTPASADAYFMFGYLSYQLGENAAARDALQRVADARPRDTLTRQLLSIAKPARE